MPKVSILIPVYTGWEFLHEALASILCQTCKDWQVFIGLNGHPENSFANAHCSLLSRWALVFERGYECLGVQFNKVSTLNHLASKATGDYIALLDADDVWSPFKLELQMQLLGKYPDLDLVATAGRYFGDTSGEIPLRHGPVFFDRLLENNDILNSSVVIRREHAHWEPTDTLEDYPKWLGMAYAGCKMFVMPDILTGIRVHPGQYFAGKDADVEKIRTTWKQRSQPSPCAS
jgi:glycosyltransferase involved in cell wall biosynthesis